MLPIQPGPVVSGNRSPSELIPELLRELERLDPNAVLFGARRASEIRKSIPPDPKWWASEDAELVVEDLLCALSDCAGRDDLYFGRKSRDSSVLGFWTSDD